jgi:uncharacterized caspase-like protein
MLLAVRGSLAIIITSQRSPLLEGPPMPDHDPIKSASPAGLGGSAAKLRSARMLCMLLLALLLALPAAAQTRVALVIGNGDYRHAPRMPNPVNDAQAMAETLTRIGFTVMHRTNLDRSNLLAALRDFETLANGADVALVFYAGHGLQVARGTSNAENYLVPVDARMLDVRDVEDETLSLGRVLERLQGAQNRILILDACRDNPLAQRMNTPGGARSIGRGLAPIEISTRGTLLAFATEPGNIASDGAGRHSPFTAALLEHLPTPGLEVRQVFTRVRAAVVQATRGTQTPWSNDGLVHEVVLVRPAAGQAPARPPATPDQADLAFWNAIRDSDNIAFFERYLDRFPNGLFRDLAALRISQLRAPKPAPVPGGLR